MRATKRGRPAHNPGWRWGAASGARLRARREELELSQAALARQARVHRSDVSEYEAGKRAPSKSALGRLARALALPDTTSLRRSKP